MAIIEIKNLDKVKNHLDSNTLLALDFDDTLFFPKGNHDPNLEFRNRFAEECKGYRVSKKYGFFSYGSKKYLELIKWFNKEAVEVEWTCLHDTPKHFYEWKDRARRVIGLTSRGLEISKQTERSLLNLNLRFDSHAHLFWDYGRDKIHKIPVRSGRAGTRSRRILYCGGHCKGEVLEHYIKYVLSIIPDLFPQGRCFGKIVMVDDGLLGLHQVAEMCKKHNIEFIGLHYVQP